MYSEIQDCRAGQPKIIALDINDQLNSPCIDISAPCGARKSGERGEAHPAMQCTSARSSISRLHIIYFFITVAAFRGYMDYDQDT